MYNHSLIEKKWVKFWEENKTNKFIDDPTKPKYFCLNEFPYPSGDALHCGHGTGWSNSDIHARYKVAKGYNVLFPIGWDAYGLPAEQFAIKNNQDPNIFTQKNISKMRDQLKEFGLLVDNDKEVDTTDPKYYALTQWIFAKFFENNLAIKEKSEVNWCEQLNTVLANDEIIIKDDKMYSERGEYPVHKKLLSQWTLKITDYAKQLTNDLEQVEWPSADVQKQWIGVSSGVKLKFKTTVENINIEVFTTRIDTIFGVSFIVIAPENDIVNKLTISEKETEVNKYIDLTNSMTELERKENKEKTGVFTGSYAINPFSGKKIPIYVANYVLNNYATGMVMGVAAHDQRDFDFAKKFNLDIIPVIENTSPDCANVSDGKHINSDFLNGLNKEEAINKATEFVIKNNLGVVHTTTKLHDWVFSRQRYWGEPFPIIYDKNNNPKLVDLKTLPVTLPKMENYNFSKSADVYVNPLEHAKNWTSVNINGEIFTRESNTMPGSAGSSWYFLAYILKNNDGSYTPFDSEEGQKRLKRWMPVDLYLGGKEHTTGHVLYARFWNKFLHNIGYAPTTEFFKKRIDHGIILAEDGRKMSKRWGNVINPSSIISSHGADALRTYFAFIGPIDGIFPWKSSGVDGVRKWLDRVYNMFFNNTEIKIVDDIKLIDQKLNIAFNKFIKNVDTHLDEFKHNLAVSDMMIFFNECNIYKNIYKEHVKGFLTILSFFAPHLAEELYSHIFKTNKSIVGEEFPKYDDKIISLATFNLPIQVNGKLRATIEVEKTISESEAIELSFGNENVLKYVPDRKYKKVIFVNGKIINFIV